MLRKEIEIKGKNKGCIMSLDSQKKLNFVYYIQIKIAPCNYYMASTCYGIFRNILNFINFFNLTILSLPTNRLKDRQTKTLIE